MALIPGKNPMAVTAYYLGIFSLVPCFGIALGIGAIICGIIGLVQATQHPEIEGKGHAVAGIILGIVAPIIWVVLFWVMWSV